MTTTADDVWKLLAELVEAQKETERCFQETERRFQETEAHSQRTIFKNRSPNYQTQLKKLVILAVNGDVLSKIW
jgi:hypothetical protein